MKSYHADIERAVRDKKELEIIDMQKMHAELFSHVPNHAFSKVFSRLADKGTIKRVAKGIYAKPKKGRFGNLLPNEKEIISYYIGKNKKEGVLTGYRLFNKYGLTTQLAKSVEMYSNNAFSKSKIVRHVNVRRINMRLTETAIKMIELLEILQSYHEIEDLNYHKLYRYLEDTVQQYNDEEVNDIITSLSYKKSTIASLKKVLDLFKVSHSLNRHLNSSSKYNTIQIGELYESAHANRRV